MKKYYKFYSDVTGNGIELTCKVFYSIHETPSFHFCADEWNKTQFDWKYQRNTEKSHPVTFAKSNFIKVKRISKQRSRFAFDDKEKALEHFKWMKSLQLNHTKRKVLELEVIAKAVNGKAFADIDFFRGRHLLPETFLFCNDNYSFQ